MNDPDQLTPPSTLDEALALIERQRQTLDRLQAKIIQSESHARLGEMMAGLAHELSNPLALIRSYVEVLRTPAVPASGDLRELHNSHLMKIDAAVQRMTDIMDSMLFFARPPREPRPVDLAGLIERALLLVEEPWAKEGIVVKTNLLPDVRIVADEVRLGQAILNLLINSRDAIRMGEKERGRITISLRRTEHNAELVFSDDGCGIDPANLAVIFSPYFTTKSSGQGHGLGLPITLDIIKSHGGSINCRSQPSKGTDMTIHLPLADVCGA